MRDNLSALRHLSIACFCMSFPAAATALTVITFRS